jgi:hypothetical protein
MTAQNSQYADNFKFLWFSLSLYIIRYDHLLQLHTYTSCAYSITFGSIVTHSHEQSTKTHPWLNANLNMHISHNWVALWTLLSHLIYKYVCCITCFLPAYETEALLYSWSLLWRNLSVCIHFMWLLRWKFLYRYLLYKIRQFWWKAVGK